MRFGRKSDSPDDAESSAEPVEPAVGPFDVSEVDPESGEFVDLGSLLVRPMDGADVRMQVDEQSGTVLSVLLMNDEGALELRAFAAARDGDLWSEARREIAADTARRGGTADELPGPFGPELHCQIPVTTDDGQSLMQVSRVIGHNGPRWFLRATLLGRPVVEPEVAGPWEEAIRRIAVRRGGEAMPPGEALPLHVPPEAQRID